MAWTAPSTFVAGAILTAASLNTNVRDNTLAGGPIYATEADRNAAIPTPFEGQRAYITGSTITTAAGQTTVIPTGVQTIHNGSSTPSYAANWVCVTPVGAVTNTGCSTTSTSYAAPTTAGGTNPTVTLVTGTTAIVDINSTLYNTTTSAYTHVSFAVSGATTLAGSDANSYYFSPLGGTAPDNVMSRRLIIAGLTAGTNTFTMHYKVGSGTGQYANRTIIVQGIA